VSVRARWSRLAAALALCAATTFASAEGTAIDAATAQRQLLVMLHVPPPHFRPDTSYGGGYVAAFGREGRRRVALELATRFGLRVVDDWPMSALGVDCFVLEAPPGMAIDGVAEAMARDARVESIQRMNLFRVLGRADPLYALQPVSGLWHLDELHALATGRNVRVAAIDSGVDVDHPDLSGRVVLARDFVDARPVVPEAHGTAVAGIIAARADDGVGIAGVAPGAALLALRACWEVGSDGAAVCSSFTLAKALQFALERDARIVNLSLSGPPDRLLTRLIEAALSRGAVVVTAAEPQRADGGFPASVPGVLAVAASDGHDASAVFLLAPGRDIPAPLPGRRWGFVSGASFAAAEVAGLTALLLELAPNRTPHELRASLEARDPSDHSSQRQAIDACAAVARMAGACACRCAVAHGAAPVQP
jgi:subtilisin family serine protease